MSTPLCSIYPCSSPRDSNFSGVGTWTQARQFQDPTFNLYGWVALHYVLWHLNVFLSLLALITYEEIFSWAVTTIELLLKCFHNQLLRSDNWIQYIISFKPLVPNRIESFHIIYLLALSLHDKYNGCLLYVA